MTAMYSAPLRRNEKKSLVWKYFMETENSNKTTCLLCSKSIACNQGSTSNLKKHLIVAHKMFQEESSVKNAAKKVKLDDLMDQPLKEELIELDGEIFEIDRQEALDNYEITEDGVLGAESGLVDDTLMMHKLPVKELQLEGSGHYVLVAVDQQDMYDINPEEEDAMAFLQDMKSSSEMHYAPMEITDPDADFDEGSEDRVGSKKYSVAWNYFKRVAKSKFGCKICGKELTFKNVNSTSANLMRHLRLSHQMDILNEKPTKEDRLADTDFTTDNEGEDTPAKKERLHSTRSHVWKHFMRIKKNLSKCNHCGRLINMHYSSSSNLIKHLKQMHPRAASMLQRVKEQEMKLANKDRGGMEQNTKNAVIWKAFTPTNFSATCKICHLFMPSNKPGLLWCHLKSRHLSVFNKLKPSQETKGFQEKVRKKKAIAEKIFKSCQDKEISNRSKKSKDDGRSVVWKFFIRRKGACLCILCKHMLDNKNRSTTNLWKHVRALHPNTIEFIMNPDNMESCRNRRDLIQIATGFEEVDVSRGSAFLFFNKKGKSAEEFFKLNKSNIEFSDDDDSGDNEEGDEDLLTDERFDAEADAPSIRSSDSEDESELIEIDTRRSIVWKFFRLTGDSGICIYCNKKIKKETNGKTLIFHEHLRRHHFKIYTRTCAKFSSLPPDSNFFNDEDFDLGGFKDLEKLESLKFKNLLALRQESERLQEEYVTYFHSLGTLDFCQLCNRSVENLADPIEHVFWSHRENFIITALQGLDDENIDSTWSDELLKPIPKYLLNYFMRVLTLQRRSVTLCRICYERIEPMDAEAERPDSEEDDLGEETLISHLLRTHLSIFVSRDPLNLILNTSNIVNISHDRSNARSESMEAVWIEHCTVQEKNYQAEIDNMKKILKAKEERLIELEEDVLRMYGNIAMRQEIRRQEVRRILGLNDLLLRPNIASEQNNLAKDFLDELNFTTRILSQEEENVEEDSGERDVKFSSDVVFTENQLHNINEHYRLQQTVMPTIKIGSKLN